MSKRKVLDAEDDSEVAGPEFVEEFCTKPYFDEDGVQVAAGIGLDGREYGDPVPMAPPVGFSAPPDLMTMMRQMITSDYAQRKIMEEGWDTFEEAGDFDVDDDPIPPLTIHEAVLITPPAAAPAAPVASPVPAAPQVAVPGEAAVASPPPANDASKSSTST